MDTNNCNGNQYNYNNNSILVILLLLILLECDKTKQKCEAISNALQEGHAFNEDIETITNDSKMDSNQVKNNRIKNNIEKAKIKMLIKELEANTQPDKYLEEVDEQGIEPLAKEKIEDLNKEELEELNKEESEKLEEPVELVEPVEIVEPKGAEKPEESKEPKESKEAEKLGESKELEEAKEAEKAEEPEEPEEPKESEEPENEILEVSVKENLEELKNLANNFSENAIRPMEIILKQLVGENIIFSTVSSSNRFVANATLLSVKDGIVYMDTSQSVLSIPICEIVGVESNLIHSIELLPLVEISTGEFYEYKEWSLKNLFSTMIGEQISIETIGSGRFNNISDKTVTNIGQGIVVLDNTMAISLNKIILVERR